jgi:hypothetical protein
LIALCVAIPIIAYAESNPPGPRPAEIQNPKQPEAEGTHKPTEPDNGPSKITPSIVKQIPTEEAKPKPSEHSDKGGDQSSADWWMVKLTAILAAIGFLQLVVFGRQATRLRQTIEAMEKIGADQSRDTQASIAIADKAAKAANQSAEVAERALIAVNRPWVRPQVIKVDPIVITEQKLSFGITLQFINTGKSPAFNVDYSHDFVALGYPRLSIRQDDMCKAAEMFSAQADEKLKKNFTIFPNEPDSLRFHPNRNGRC